MSGNVMCTGLLWNTHAILFGHHSYTMCTYTHQELMSGKAAKEHVTTSPSKFRQTVRTGVRVNYFRAHSIIAYSTTHE